MSDCERTYRVLVEASFEGWVKVDGATSAVEAMKSAVAWVYEEGERVIEDKESTGLYAVRAELIADDASGTTRQSHGRSTAADAGQNQAPTGVVEEGEDQR